MQDQLIISQLFQILGSVSLLGVLALYQNWHFIYIYLRFPCRGCISSTYMKEVRYMQYMQANDAISNNTNTQNYNCYDPSMIPTIVGLKINDLILGISIHTLK